MSKSKSIKLKPASTNKEDLSNQPAQLENKFNQPEPLEDKSDQPTQLEDKPNQLTQLESNEDLEMKSLEDVISNVGNDANPNNYTINEQGEQNNHLHSHGEEFLPLPPDYIIRQQQIATYQMLSQFLLHKDKGIAEILQDVRLSVIL